MNSLMPCWILPASIKTPMAAIRSLYLISGKGIALCILDQRCKGAQPWTYCKKNKFNATWKWQLNGKSRQNFYWNGSGKNKNSITKEFSISAAGFHSFLIYLSLFTQDCPLKKTETVERKWHKGKASFKLHISLC